MSYLINPFMFGGGVVGDTTFLATNSGTQSIPANDTTEVDFGTEIVDGNNVFASNRFTVPASLDGQYAEVYFGYEVDTAVSQGPRVQVDTGGGFDDVAVLYDMTQRTSIGTGPVALADGDIYRAAIKNEHASVAVTCQRDDSVFFAGLVTEGSSFFRAVPSGTQVINANTLTQLEFGTEVFDPDGVFASNVFTVPAADNGKFAVVTAGFDTSTDEAYNLYLEYDDGGGYGYYGQTSHDGEQNGNLTTGVIQVATGDKFKLTYYGSATTKSASALNFLSGRVFSATKAFRATNASTQGVSATTETEVVFGTEDFDTESAFASNRFTVPAALDGKTAVLYAGLRLLTKYSGIIEIQRSTDGGSNWDAVAKQQLYQMNAHSFGRPVVLADGDIYRVTIYTTTGATINNTQSVFFSGIIFD